jgi:hypothetical protein
MTWGRGLFLSGGQYPMGEMQDQSFQLSFNASLKVDFLRFPRHFRTKRLSGGMLLWIAGLPLPAG